MSDRVKTQLALANEKIRELEAELATAKAWLDGAEARGGVWRNFARARSRAEKAEARVAELEREVKKEYERAEYNAMCVAKNVEHGWSGKHQAREREDSR